MKTQNTKKFRVVRFFFDKELNDNGKRYTSKEDATNAGNSWERDCTVDQNDRRGRAFEVVEINN
jgi:hypothetical protein